MNPLKVLQDILQYPQSVVTGIAAAAPGMHGQARNTTGDLNKIVEGFKGGYRPSDMMLENDNVNYERTAAANFLRGLGELGTDIAYDPTLAFSGGASKLPGAAGRLGKSATTFGKLGEGAGKTDKAAQAARYLYNGMLASGGDPMQGLAVAGLMPVAERGAGKVAAKLFSRAGTQIADDLVGEGAESILSRKGIDQIEDEYQQALQMLGRDMPEAPVIRPGQSVEGPGFSMTAEGGGALVPYRGTTGNPVADEARAYLSANPQADASDVLFDVPGVGGMDQATDVLRLAKSGVDKSGIPLSDRGALFNKKLMDDLGWDGALVDTWQKPALPAAPVARPMGATTSQAIVPFQEQLGPLPIQKIPESLMAPTRPYSPPAPGMLNAAPEFNPIPMGPALPVGASSPYVSRPRGMDPDVEMLKEALQNAILERNKPRQALNRGMSAQEELLFKLAGGM